LRSYDEAAQPFTGYGLTLIPDDIARFAGFLMSADGMVNGQQVLDPDLLAAALQQDASDPGMTVESNRLRYNNGLWAANLLPKEVCPDETWIPFMSGYGGISVAMMPNDTIYYVFSDNAHFKWAQAAIESNRIKPFCENPDHDF
jgi:CubicO group peptidase (beta-lactamase class C family)